MDAKDYSLIAKYYDGSYGSRADLNDLPFYLDIAKQHGGPVLEIACGTGRVLLEIAKQGIDITGLDYSEDMLSILNEKLKQESQNVQNIVDLCLGDMRTFSLGKQFRLILIPFRSLQHMYTIEDQLKVFKRVKEHLHPHEGRLVFNVFYPDFTRLNTTMDEEVFDIEWADTSQPQRVIHRYFIRYRVNKLEQYFEGAFIYKTFENDKLIKQEKSPLKLGYYTYPQMLLLFEQTGFKIVNEYGSFDKDPIDICKEMIFILRTKQT
jgi:ubiquinone/menaquinone biosynthesis C-methylase UbiE